MFHFFSFHFIELEILKLSSGFESKVGTRLEGELGPGLPPIQAGPSSLVEQQPRALDPSPSGTELLQKTALKKGESGPGLKPSTQAGQSSPVEQQPKALEPKAVEIRGIFFLLQITSPPTGF